MKMIRVLDRGGEYKYLHILPKNWTWTFYPYLATKFSDEEAGFIVAPSSEEEIVDETVAFHEYKLRNNRWQG